MVGFIFLSIGTGYNLFFSIGLQFTGVNRDFPQCFIRKFMKNNNRAPCEQRKALAGGTNRAGKSPAGFIRQPNARLPAAMSSESASVCPSPDQSVTIPFAMSLVIQYCRSFTRRSRVAGHCGCSGSRSTCFSGPCCQGLFRAI